MPRILVLGATGKTGSRVSEGLRQRGIVHRTASRSASPPFDWHASETWPAALDGVDVVYAPYVPDLAAPGAPEVIEAFASTARAAGVERVVLLSERRASRAQQCESILKESGLGWTVLQAAWFMQNFSQGGFHRGVMDGLVTVPVHGTREPFIDAEDLADVAVDALLDNRHAGKTYELTGPELLSWPEAVARIGAAIGRPVAFEPTTADGFEATLVADGFPEEDANVVATLVEQILDGRNENLASGVEEALGRPGGSFDAFVQREAAAGAWAVSQGGAS